MPKPFTPSKDEWIEEIGRAVGAPDENIFLVGHSLGVPAVLQYIQSLPDDVKIGGAVLVSGPIRNVPDEYSTRMETFFHPDWDFSKIEKACKKFAVIHGDNDTVVAFSDAQEFSKALSCELVSIPNGGHLNGSSGHRELPQALTVLTNWVKAIS
jgi:predicted alpha/beta hydrolase family esterase